MLSFIVWLPVSGFSDFSLRRASCFHASKIHFAISFDWLNPANLQSAFNLSTASTSSLTVTAFNGSERGLRPAPFRFPPLILQKVFFEFQRKRSPSICLCFHFSQIRNGPQKKSGSLVLLLLLMRKPFPPTVRFQALLSLCGTPRINQ